MKPARTVTFEDGDIVLYDTPSLKVIYTRLGGEWSRFSRLSGVDKESRTDVEVNGYLSGGSPYRFAGNVLTGQQGD